MDLQRFMSLQRDRQQRRQRIQTLNGSIASVNKAALLSAGACGAARNRKSPETAVSAPRRNAPPLGTEPKRKSLPYQQDGHGYFEAVKRTRCSSPTLPEDILDHIHSLLPMRAAARAACVSHAFLRSWRCRPVLVLNMRILGLGSNRRSPPRNFSCIIDNILRKHSGIGSNRRSPPRNFSCIIDNILRKHSGIGIKVFKLELPGIFYTCHCLDSWLQIAVTPGIEALTLKLCAIVKMKYNVPCTLLSDGVRNSIRDLQLSSCAFHPTAELGILRNLTSLGLSSVSISGDELECFLSNSPALKKLYLSNCPDIMCLKIPSVMLQLHCMEVSVCLNLRVIDSKARNLSSFTLSFGERVKVSLGETLQMKNLSMHRSNFICYARCELASNMPNLERLAITSNYERVDTPMLPTKFVFLKWLAIRLPLGSSSYDCFSLVSFLDASPSLETWLLDVVGEGMEHESIFGGSSQLRKMPERHHACLKRVIVQGFTSAKGLVELMCYILKNAMSLYLLKLDTTYGDPKCDNKIAGWCTPMSEDFLMKARRGAAAIRTYIEDKVPPTVKLTVVEHCRRCHADSLPK